MLQDPIRDFFLGHARVMIILRDVLRYQVNLPIGSSEAVPVAGKKLNGCNDSGSLVSVTKALLGGQMPEVSGSHVVNVFVEVLSVHRHGRRGARRFDYGLINDAISPAVFC